MPGTDIMTHSAVILHPDPSRTVLRPFDLNDPDGFKVEGHSRAQRIVDRVMTLDPEALQTEVDRVVGVLISRHRNVEEGLLRRFAGLEGLTIDTESLDHAHKLLIGAYFTEEYSFEAAALFNPSIVANEGSSDLPEGTVRFTMSLRGIGEGHVSSVTFRTGTWSSDGTVTVDAPTGQVVSPEILAAEGEGEDTIIRIRCDGSENPSETVLFPVTPNQRQGIEDLRLVRFVEDDGTVQYLGTYTAFSGTTARSEMLHVQDFRNFEMRALKGSAAHAKGMALFPRRIGGRYAMLGRQDNENVWLLMSDDLYTWERGAKLIEPRWPWEFIQMGNCGSPIELDEGWLVLTHGVGTVRTYCIGAALLDKDDPAKLLKRMTLPLVHPSPKERDGYVPNVIYSCGALVHERRLLLPYGVADNFATFATVSVDELLARME